MTLKKHFKKLKGQLFEKGHRIITLHRIMMHELIEHCKHTLRFRGTLRK